MTVIINQDMCIGCGTCESLCSDVFKVNQQGKAEVISQNNLACAKNAAENCPAQAIKIE